jgi:hypothetical protein
MRDFAERPVPPPPQAKLKPSLALTRLWQEVPAGNRQKTLQVLARIIGQQLPMPPTAKEVAHEHP